MNSLRYVTALPLTPLRKRVTLTRLLGVGLVAAGIFTSMMTPGRALARPEATDISVQSQGATIPATVTEPRQLPAMPLQTQDHWIVDSTGNRVKLASANWFGAESPEHVVGGLDTAPLTSITRWLREHGFNSIRLPWSNELVESNPVVKPEYLAANPELVGLRGLEILDRVIAAAAAEGLMVVLDNHRSRADWCCDEEHGDGLWYSEQYPEAAWIADWKTMATRYRNQPAVVAAELRNEIRPDPAVTSDKPSWGDGNAATDWKRAAELGGNAVLSANPHLLVIIGGMEYQGSLEAAYEDPARLSAPHRIVYSAHDYVFFNSDEELADYSVYKAKLDRRWGKMLQSAPVYVSEFGTCTSGECTLKDLNYLRFITRYLNETDADWAYWPLNGTQSEGYSREHGAPESYGLLDESWQRGSNDLVLALLLRIQDPEQGPGVTRRREDL